MTEHIHRCLSCTPDMVPDFDRADPRYHDGEKCGPLVRVSLDGAEMTYAGGIFEGQEGWLLFAGAAVDDLHQCPCGADVCVETRFGRAEVAHGCPSGVVEHRRALREALRPFASHALAGDLVESDRERPIGATEGQVARAWFALHGELP